MGQTFTGKFTISTSQVSYVNALDLGNVTDSVALAITSTLTNGTGAGKAQGQWTDTRTLTTGANETLDLKALAGAAFGTAAVTKIKAIVVQLTTATTGYTLTIEPGASNGLEGLTGATGVITVTNGGAVAMLAPNDGVTVDNTHKTLKITNPAGGSATYNIVIWFEGSVA